jgi:hypothetical protein
MGEDKSSHLTLAAEAEPAELEKSRAKNELAWAVRELAANLLRVIRGAGRPHVLPQQIINLGEAILETHKSARAWAIWSAMEDTLQSGIPHWGDEPDADAYESTIAKGALQLVASHLLHQHAQEAAGGREISDGIKEAEEMRERMRRRWEAERPDVALIRARRVFSRRTEQAPKPRKPKPKAAPAPKAAPVVKAALASTATDEPAERPASTAEFMRAQQKRLHGDGEC